MAKQKDTPFALSDQQMAALDALVETGCNKSAARVMGVTVRTLESHLTMAYAKMGGANRLTRILAWDRMRRAQQGAAQ